VRASKGHRCGSSGTTSAPKACRAAPCRSPGDGQPLVLLADRGRTGGYAVPAVVDPRDLWQLAQAGPGSEVWFLPTR
jgi:allophanate hydrolase subunit 2